MPFADSYIAKHTSNEYLIDEKPAKDLNIVVIIPSYNESELIKSLDSLFKAKLPGFSVEIIVNINWPEYANNIIIESSERLFEEALSWSEKHSTDERKFFIIKNPFLKKKHAGVGLARKIAMDEAIRRYNLLNNKKGIICSFDADALCDPDYFQKIAEHFKLNPSTDACSIYFEHPTSGTEFPEKVYQGIILYELHLRYYVQALRYTGHPNIFQTVGSSFAVKASTYCKEGGMNRKKAGEDFYFLQKIFDLGNYSDCNSTRVIPSPRPSDRVPFGTGRAISDYIDSGKELKTYNPKLFLELKKFILNINKTNSNDPNFREHLLESIPPLLKNYLNTIQFENTLEEIIKNSSNSQSFIKRFFRWFNMFRMMKFLNFSEQFYPEVGVKEAAITLLNIKGSKIPGETSEAILHYYRKLERET